MSPSGGALPGRTVRRTRHLTVADGTDDDRRNLALDAEIYPVNSTISSSKGSACAPLTPFPAKLAMGLAPHDTASDELFDVVLTCPPEIARALQTGPIPVGILELQTLVLNNNK